MYVKYSKEQNIMDKIEVKERLNYVRDPSGVLVGHLLNLDIIAQAKDLETLKSKMMALAEMKIKFLSEMLADTNDFDTYEVSEL